ncbi:MAG: NAD(P)/FAD-dependent oxidoreductase [Halieaceae bacterium]|nr:NAD(P)/FAD-dependent oxidoreductase [Halieaceae bacterium]
MTYDSIIIGAGHNGLVCATLLARSGQRVLVLEASDRAGGLAAEREFHPGFRAGVAQTVYALPETVIRDLALESHGFAAGEPLPLIALSERQAPITIRDDALSGASDTDSDAYAAYRSRLQTFARALAPFWEKTMPRVGATGLRDLATFGELGLKLRLLGRDDMLEFFRVATLPMRDLLDEHFENDVLKAALSWDGLVGSKLAPRSPNQAVLTLLARMAGSRGGQHYLPAGGTAGLVDALTRAAKTAGAELRLNAPVARVTIEGDENGQRCTGVRLEDGSELTARRVVSSADPKTTFFSLVGAPSLEIEFSNRIRRLRADGYVAKLHLALSGLPAFTGLDEPLGRLLIAESMDAIEFAYDDAKHGGCSERPVMEVLLPTLQRPDLAPPGQHVLAAQVMYLPAAPKGGWTEELRSTCLARLLATLERHAPGIGDLVLHAELLTPADIERDYGVSGGHWHHAEPAIDQLLMMRPTYEAAQYRTPIDGLWLCGAGSHPGGDLTGNPGRNAAREILA